MDDYLSEASEYALDLSLNYGDHVLQYSNEVDEATAAGAALSLATLGGAAYLALSRSIDPVTADLKDERDLAETGDEELEE